MRRTLIVLTVIVALGLLAGCGSFSHPVTGTVLANLAPQQAHELTVYSASHGEIFDLRLHTIYTCPFLSYTPNYLVRDHQSQGWAEWLLWFFKEKHDTEDHCVCATQLPS
jgi:hypothetical protein